MLYNCIKIQTIFYHTYWLLFCKGHIEITSNDSTISVETKNNRINKMKTLHSIHLEFILYYIMLTFFYIAKDTQSHIQITSNDSTINVETKTNKHNKTLHSIQLEFILCHITLTTLLYFNRHIQMWSNDSVKRKKTIE